MSNALEIECPNHNGGFDCSPFCKLCEGEQEIILQDPSEVKPEYGRPVLALSKQNVFYILQHLNRDFGLTRHLTDNATEALRELQVELLQIAKRYQSVTK